MEYQAFIFNWRRQEDKTLNKIAALAPLGLNPMVINSDESLEGKYDWVHLGEEAYFSAQFNAAMDMFTGDVLFHIQADAEYENWGGLVDESIRHFETYRWGVYAPNISWTPQKANIVDESVLEEGLKEVSNTDCTCWFIHRDVIDMMPPVDLSINKTGWGVDTHIMRLSRSIGRKVIRNYRHTVYHPRATGYDREEAHRQMDNYMNAIEERETQLTDPDRHPSLPKSSQVRGSPSQGRTPVCPSTPST